MRTIEAADRAVVIGGGFFGLRIALFLREELGTPQVIVLEREPEVMTRASYVNQARVHNGYHYPRSILTGYRSRVNFAQFVAEYGPAVVENFDHYYAIARRASKVNARQFRLFCQRIQAPLEPVDPHIEREFDSAMVEQVFRVVEPAFDSVALRDLVLRRIAAAGGIEIRTESPALHVTSEPEGVAVHTPDSVVLAGRVINATYSGLNALNQASSVAPIGVQHELTELALVKVPPVLEHVGVTVMDGPFFSCMPFPSRRLHSLSHVRYTPHRRWRDAADRMAEPSPIGWERPTSRSNFPKMRADVARYLPRLANARHVDSLYEVKTVLSRSANDDSRPILYRPSREIPGFTSVMGGKLDNVEDVLEEMRHEHQG